MSKTVIVFSTRYIYPLFGDCLFSESQCQRKIFSHKNLADFFWNGIKQNNEYLKSILTDDYFVNKQKNDLVNFLTRYQKVLEEVILNHGLEHQFSTTDFNWIGYITNNANISFEEQVELKKLFMAYNKSIDDTSQLRETDSLDLCKALKTDTYQKPFNLDVKDDGK